MQANTGLSVLRLQNFASQNGCFQADNLGKQSSSKGEGLSACVFHHEQKEKILKEIFRILEKYFEILRWISKIHSR